MFCKECGSNIKEGADFCPKCGKKVNGNSGQAQGAGHMGAKLPGIGTGAQAMRKKSGLTDGQKKLIVIAAGVAVVVLVLVLVVARQGHGEDETVYSLTGTWNSEDMVNLENAISNLLVEEAGLDEWVVQGLMEMTGVSYLGDVTVTFDEGGGLWIGGGGVSLTVGNFSYQEISDDIVMLKLAFDVPVIGEISASYQAKYTLDKDRLVLDLFGINATFRRQE